MSLLYIRYCGCLLLLASNNKTHACVACVLEQHMLQKSVKHVIHLGASIYIITCQRQASMSHDAHNIRILFKTKESFQVSTTLASTKLIQFRIFLMDLTSDLVRFCYYVSYVIYHGKFTNLTNHSCF